MTQIGKYLVRREIGRGGMAVVYEADDPDLRRAVALKVLSSSDPESSAVKRFHREASLAAGLRHPNIIAVHDVGQAPGDNGATVYFIAMDLVRGRTLQQFLSSPDALRLLEDVSRAAGHAHSQGIVHRDLKPANVLVDDSGRAVLTDFGLARGDDESRLTRDGAVLGTPVYMAPEQVEGRNDDVGPRTDVYALGVMLYEILAGRPPFVGDTAAQVYAQILTSEPSRPSAGRADFEAICLKAMERDASRRYGDGTDFADDLARARRGDPVLATRPGLFTRAARRLRRRSAWILFAAVTLVAVSWPVLTHLRIRARLRDSLDRAAKAATLDEARDAWRDAADLGSADARREFEAVSALLRRREDDREAARRNSEARALAQERAFKQLELGRPSLDQAVALLSRADAPIDEMFRLADAALDAFRVAQETAPWLAEARYLAGRAWEIRGDPERAEQSWSKAAELDPSYGPALFLLGRSLLIKAYIATCYHKTRSDAPVHAAKAAEALDAATREGSGFDDAVLGVAARAMAHHVRGEDAAARKLGEDGVAALRSRPGVEDLHWLLALAAAEPAEGLGHFDRCLALRPLHPAALLGRGLACMRLARFAEAERDFGRVAALWPRSRDAWNCLGTARHARGQFDAAIADYGRALHVDPEFVHALCNRASALATRADRLAASGRQAEADEARRDALADYDRAVVADPGHPIPRDGRGSLRLAMGAVEEALADFSEAVRIDPDDLDALASRANARRTLGDSKGALLDLDSSLARNPNHVPSLQQRFATRYATHDIDGAMSDADRLVAITPTATAFMNRGAMKLLLKRTAEAVADLTSALERQPGHLDALYNRAVAHVMLERWKEARDDADAALRLSPAGWKSRAEMERLRDLARSRLK